MRKQEGFSLIELLIVVAIILVISAIAVPNLIRSRRAANEASAVNSTRTIASAEITYYATFPTIGYTCTLTDLGPGGGVITPNSAGLIDENLASGQKANYDFALDPSHCASVPAVSFFVTATPRPGGVRNFCSDASAVIRYDPGNGVCTATSEPIQ